MYKAATSNMNFENESSLQIIFVHKSYMWDFWKLVLTQIVKNYISSIFFNVYGTINILSTVKTKEN